MEKVEGKIIIFLLLVLIFTSPADYCVTCMSHIFIIDPREEATMYRAEDQGREAPSRYVS